MQADLDTLQRVRVVLADAMERGLDAAEALDRAGLVHHDGLVTQIGHRTLQAAATALEMTTVDQVARELSERQPSSPGEMKRQIVAFLLRMATP